MSILFDGGNNPSVITYNGVNLSQVIFNGVEVWSTYSEVTLWDNTAYEQDTSSQGYWDCRFWHAENGPTGNAYGTDASLSHDIHNISIDLTNWNHCIVRAKIASIGQPDGTGANHHFVIACWLNGADTTAEFQTFGGYDPEASSTRFTTLPGYLSVTDPSIGYCAGRPEVCELAVRDYWPEHSGYNGYGGPCSTSPSGQGALSGNFVELDFDVSGVTGRKYFRIMTYPYSATNNPSSDTYISLIKLTT